MRDAEDARLLETGEHGVLLAAYYPVIRQRCLLAVRGDAEDVGQKICVRLATELVRGKRYRVPFRVVVHQFIRWAIMDHRAEVSIQPLPADWDIESIGDPFADVEAHYDLDRLFQELSEADRRVAELRYYSGLEIDEIAARLGKRRNAVDQALWRVHHKLRELILGD